MEQFTFASGLYPYPTYRSIPYVQSIHVTLVVRGVLKMETVKTEQFFAYEHYPCQSTFGRIILSWILFRPDTIAGYHSSTLKRCLNFVYSSMPIISTFSITSVVQYMTAKADSISNSGGSRVEVQSIHVTLVSSSYPVYIRPNKVKLDRKFLGLILFWLDTIAGR
jgi:hypothetical protein